MHFNKFLIRIGKKMRKYILFFSVLVVGFESCKLQAMSADIVEAIKTIQGDVQKRVVSIDKLLVAVNTAQTAISQNGDLDEALRPVGNSASAVFDNKQLLNILDEEE